MRIGSSPLSTKICLRCDYFNPHYDTCQINPPVRLPRKFAPEANAGARIRDENVQWGWPRVEKDDWCGQWLEAKHHEH